MAKVSFSALIEEIVGKLAGSVFQDSYGGFQIRTRVSPRNPQSNFQQLRRGEFGYISALWRTLTSIQRQSFIDAAASPAGGLNLFIQSNVNLSLIGQPIISTYPTPSVPADMPLQIDTLDTILFEVSASGATTTVPTGFSLILFATYEKPPTRIFTNPSQFSPITIFPAGTDLSTSIDVAADWIARYGQFTENKRICIKSALVENISGLRTDAAVTCANQSEMLPYQYYYANLSQSGTADPVAVEAPGNTLGPITWTRTAAGLYEGTSSGLFTAGKTFLASVPIGSGPVPQIQFYSSTINTVNIGTYVVGGLATDGQLLNFGIQILVFP